MTDALAALAPTDEDLAAMNPPAELTPPPTPPEPAAPAPPPVIPPVTPPVAGPPKDTPEMQIEKLNMALREARGEIRDMKGRVSKIDEIKNVIGDWQRQQTEAAKPKVPAFEEDPIGHQQAVLKQIQEQNQQIQQQQQQLTQDQQFQKIIHTVSSYENEFRRTMPDYDAAQKFIVDMRRKELEAFGVTNEQEIAADLGQNAFSLSVSALQRGKNPAEVIYNIAVQRGYKPAAPATSTAQAAAAVPAAEIQKQQAALESIQRGQAAAITLSGKGDAETNPSLQAVLDAPVGSPEFEAAWAAYFGKK